MQCVFDWDEARHGVNAFEMMQRHNYIANYYDGELDYWNLKPPLSLYLVMLGYKMFGFNIWGLRFFTVLAFLLTAIIIALFLKKHVGKIPSLLSLMFFITNPFFLYDYYLNNHWIRSADPDAILILFVAIALITLYLSSRNSNWLHLTALAFALGFLTKSWHACFLLPIVFFYLIFTKGFPQIKWWQYFTIALSALVPLAIWAISRYSFDGIKFFQEMFNYDLIARSTSLIEDNQTEPLYYLHWLRQNYIMLICLIIFIIGLLLKIKNKARLNHLDILCSIAFLSIILIYSMSKTKDYWYIYPCCVPLYIAGASYLGQFIQSSFFIQNMKTCLVGSFCMILVLTLGFCKNINGVNHPTSDDLQTFMETMPFDKDVTYYYENREAYIQRYELSVPQRGLLYLEWRTKQIPNAPWGGYDYFVTAYEESDNVKLILSRPTYKAINDPNLVIQFETADYLLCYLE